MSTNDLRNEVNILLLENVNEEGVKAFYDAGYTHIRQLKQSLSEEELIAQISEVHILGIRSKTKITERVLDAAPKLQAIGCFCIGTNQVDIDCATQRGVAVFNAPYSNTRSVAELVIGAAIMLVRHIPDKNRMAHEGTWMKDASHSHELRGKTIGIIGYGNIGTQVSVLAEAMGMKVCYYDALKKLPLGNAAAVDSLQSLLQVSDIISVHVPALPGTVDMINRDNIVYCKPGAVLINYARGEVVDLAAVKWALEQGILSGAAVDVFKDEPARNGDAFACVLQNMANVLLTPHIGGSTEEAQVSIGHDVSNKLLQFMETGSTSGSHTVPELSLPFVEHTHRILHVHRNVPGVLSEINAAMSANGINILGQYLKTNQDIGYVVLDVGGDVSQAVVDMLINVKDTIKVRMLY